MAGATEMSFYVTGGTLRQDAPSYVERQADKDLIEGLLKGEFCYVLTSRQMGKSSLMVRTAGKLREQGVNVAVLDLTAIGQNLTPEQWYDGLMLRLGQQLRLEDELEDFWDANRQLGPCQRFFTAIREVVLPKSSVSSNQSSVISNQSSVTQSGGAVPLNTEDWKLITHRLVVFVDELDVVRSLPFSTDEFFAAIRACYNRRTEDAEWERLTFCLLGVATPSDLIRDTRLTPFNIGRRVELNDFTEREALPLAKGLANSELGTPNQELLLNRILHWTFGHPYLTQRLCQAIAAETKAAGEADVDRLCADIFFSSRAREQDDNLLFVRERMLRAEVDRASLLHLYERVVAGKPVRDDDANPLVTALRLSGVTRNRQGWLEERNRIYERVFDRDWVGANMPDAELRRQKAAFRRGVVRTAGIAAVMLAVVSALGLIAVRQAARARHNEQQEQRARKAEASERERAQNEAARARRTAYNSDMNLAQQALQLNNVGRALGLLNRHRPNSGEKDLRGWEWRYLWQSCQSDASFTLCRQSKDIFSVAFSKDGELLALADESGEVAVWDMRSRKRIMSQATHMSRQRISFSPISNHLAFCQMDSNGAFTVRLWNAQTLGDAIQLPLPHAAREMVFARDADVLATWDWNWQGGSRIILWESASGRKSFEFPAERGGNGMGNLLALAHHGQTIACGTTRGEIVVLEVATGREKLRLSATAEQTMAVAISNDGTTLASAAGFTDPFIKLWDLGTGNEIARLEGHRSYVNELAFSPDGRLLASASGDQTIRLWDWKAKQPVATLRGHLSEVLAVAISPDGKTMASGCKDGTVMIWSTTPKRAESDYVTFPAPVSVWKFTADGKSIITLVGGMIRAWASADFHESQTFMKLGTNNTSFELSKNEQLLAIGDSTGQVRVINLATEREASAFQAGSESVTVIGFSTEEDLLFTLDSNNVVSLWEVRSRRLRTQWAIKAPFYKFRLASGADVLATGKDGELTMWRARDGHRLWTRRAQDEFEDIGFSGDGKMVATASGKGTTKLFDARTGGEIATLGGFLLGTHSLAFSPDHQRLAISSNGKEAVKLWDTQSFQEVLTLEGKGSIFQQTAFSPDGTILGSANNAGVLHLWRAPSLAAIEEQERNNGGWEQIAK